MAFKFHVSSLKSFLQCRRQFYLTDPEYLGLEPTSIVNYFYMGTLTHSTFEDYYTGRIESLTESFMHNKRIYEQLTGERLDTYRTYNEDMDMLYELFKQYELWIDSPIDKLTPFGDHNLEYIAMEVPFDIPIYENIRFGGRFDGIVRRKDNGDLLIYEVKTTSRPDQLIASLDYELQTKAYVFAARELGYPVKGVLYNIMNKAPSGVPTILKNGKLSKSKSQKVSYEVYRYWMHMLHPDWTQEQLVEEYSDFLHYLLSNNQVFQRYYKPVTNTEIAKFIVMLDNIGPELMNLDEDSAFPTGAHNAHFTCGFCRFKNPCINWERGNIEERDKELNDFFIRRTDRINRQFDYEPFVIYRRQDEFAAFHNTNMVSPFAESDKVLKAIESYAKQNNIILKDKEEWNQLIGNKVN